MPFSGKNACFGVSNHYLLLVELREANLSRAVQRLNQELYSGNVEYHTGAVFPGGCETCPLIARVDSKQARCKARFWSEK
jgi:hypothetical protein